MMGASSFLRGIPQEDVQSKEERENAHVYFSDVPTIMVSQPMCPPKPEQVELKELLPSITTTTNPTFTDTPICGTRDIFIQAQILHKCVGQESAKQDNTCCKVSYGMYQT